MNATCDITEPALQTESAESANPNPSTTGNRTRRRVVVVLGMHRSGTSLLTNLLTLLGVDVGEDLLPADANNEAGYWEQEEIFHTQEELLRSIGHHWIGHAGTVPLPDRWWMLPEVGPFRERLKLILRKEFARAQGMWGFKDPRTSRLLPLWHDIFNELDLEPVYLLAFRDPAAVVESLHKRDRLSASQAELLWLTHNLDAIRDAGSRLRAVVDFDRWFTHPREQAQSVADALGMAWPKDEEELLEQLQQRIRPDLRHCKSRCEFTLPFVRETFAALQEAAAIGRLPEQLSRIDSDVRRAFALCQPWSSAIGELLSLQPDGNGLPFESDFDEDAYLSLHKDVAQAVRDGKCESGWQHFVQFGFNEQRRWLRKRPSASTRLPDNNTPMIQTSLPPSGSHKKLTPAQSERAMKLFGQTGEDPSISSKKSKIPPQQQKSPGVELEIIEEIGAGDEMFTGDKGHYFGVGKSALHCIESAMLAANKPADSVRNILDLPCGHGRVMRFLKAALPHAGITACDLNKSAVDFCASTFGAQPVYSNVDVNQIPLRGKYDLIWSGSLLTHLRSEPCADFVRLFNSLINPGGLIMFTLHGRWVERSLATRRYTYGLTEQDVTALLAEYYQTGFGYADYPGASGYGISLSSPAYVLSRLIALPDLKLITYHEKGWDNHQDVICLQKQTSAELLG